MLFVFVAMLAAGAAFAYDTKIIDEGTDLNNLHQSVRPIAHYGVDDNRGVYEDKSVKPSVFKYKSVYYPSVRHGVRSIGVGYTVEDKYADTGANSFFGEGHRVGVSDGDAPNGYFSKKQEMLAIDGGHALNLQQAESTAVWRAIPMMTGTLMDSCGSYVYPLGQAWIGEANIATALTKDTKAAAAGRINAWPYADYADKKYYDEDGKTYRKTYKFWGDTIDRTPTAHPSEHSQDVDDPRYGYAVPRIEARNIAHALYRNPGTNVGTDGDPFTIGQETMTSVFVWSADRAWSTDKDMMGLGEAPDTVAVMVRLDNDLYKGMKVSDLNVIKVEANDGKWQGELTRVDSASQLRKNTFLVVHRSDENARDVVVNGDHIIQAGNRALAGSGGVCPTTATCDMEWRTMQYFVLLAVQKEDPWDVADPRPDYKEVVGGLHIVVAERPFTKTPNLCCSYPDDTEPRFGWVLGNRPNAEQRYDGFTRDPFLADAISGRPANFGYTSGYTQAFIDDVMGGEPWNQMFFVKKEVVEAYGYADSIVYKLPAVRAGDVPDGKTALVMYTIRLGKGEMELDPDDFVGKTPADIQVIDVRSAEKPEGDMTEFTRATDATQLTDGHFAILMPNPLARHEQVFVPEGHQFEADGIYFVALAVKDNGEFDLDQMKPLSNNQSWVSPAFLVIGGKKADPELRVSPTSATVNVGDTQQFTASISDGSEVPPVTWTSSDPAVATVDENGLATAVAAGAATITCAPEVGSGYAPVDVTLTVETPAPPSGGSGGGCSVGGFGPASLFLLAPLFLLLKK